MAKGAPPEEIVNHIAKHPISTLVWEDCVRGMILDGLLEIYQVGPGEDGLSCDLA